MPRTRLGRRAESDAIDQQRRGGRRVYGKFAERGGTLTTVVRIVNYALGGTDTERAVREALYADIYDLSSSTTRVYRWSGLGTTIYNIVTFRERAARIARRGRIDRVT